MATKRKLIERAAAGFGLTGAFDISPEEMQEGLDGLNALAAEWDGIGIRVGYNFGSDIEAQSGVPDTAENAFVSNLSVRWAGNFGREPTLNTKVTASKTWSALYVARGIMPVQARNPALPVGAGNRTGVLGQQYFPDPGDEVQGLNDGATEY